MTTDLTTIDSPAVHALASGVERLQTVIEPPCGWQLINVRELWEYRELLGFLIWRDVKVRYRQTLLGAAWAVLQPALMMIVFTVFFSRLAGMRSGDIPYPLFVLAGLLPWNLFSTAVSQGAQSVVNSERLITKIYFPRLAIPLASVGAAIVDFCVALGLLAALLAWYGVAPSVGWLAVPAIVLGLLLAAVGIGTLLAALNVVYRDFRYLVPFLLQVWMFATPTIYMDPRLGAAGGWSSILSLNPLVPLIAAFRAAIVGEPIAWLPVAYAACAAGVMFVTGCLIFRRVEDSFSDLI